MEHVLELVLCVVFNFTVFVDFNNRSIHHEGSVVAKRLQALFVFLVSKFGLEI
jgi:hypothetical protein